MVVAPPLQIDIDAQAQTKWIDCTVQQGGKKLAPRMSGGD